MTIQSNLPTGFAIIGALSVIIAATAWPQPDSDSISRGKQTYSEKRCAFCHVIQGKGGNAGPDLSDVGAKHDTQWLERFMTAPSVVVPKAKMPSFKGSAEELDALVSYLGSLK